LDHDTMSRKLDHIRAVLERDVEARESTLLEYTRIVHRGLPEVDLDDVSLDVEFCGARLKAPIMITAMTGGHPETANINRSLARQAARLGIAIGVGSQRAAIEDPSLAYTYRVVREEAPNAFVVANLGAPQFARGYGVREARAAVEMIDADALAIHLNPGQEAYQVEGDPYYEGVIAKILEVADNLGVPVIVKETGTGLSMEDVHTLYRLGVKCFDVAGLGGTNWIKVEVVRAQMRGAKPRPAGPLADYWGNPTAIAIIEARTAAPQAHIVASGGIRTGLDAAKAIALGADVAGVALPALRALLKGGEEALADYLDSIIYQVKTAIFMAGGRSPADLWRAPLTAWGRLVEEAAARGINLNEYILRGRLEPLRGRNWKGTLH